jgi:hypothetical protein
LQSSQMFFMVFLFFSQALMILPLLNITFFQFIVQLFFCTALLCAVEKVSLGSIYYIVYINCIY